MTRARRRLPLLVALALHAAAASAQAKPPSDEAALQALFGALEIAHRQGDAARFEEHVLPAAWRENLAGGSGTSMRNLFRQGARKGWFLKPDLGRGERVGERTMIVPCAIYSWRKDRALQQAFAVAGREGGRWVLVGGGKRYEQVRALAERYHRGEPLAPAPRAP